MENPTSKIGMASSAWEKAAPTLVGLPLKYAKRSWYLDGEELATGDDGVQVCFLMDTAEHGAVYWVDQQIVERRVGKYVDDFQFDELGEGWSRYTSCIGVMADPEHFAEVVTWTSSSWGGNNAFKQLIRPYLLRGETAFPVCTLDVKDRPTERDPHGSAPVFKHAKDTTGNQLWSGRENFRDLLPSEIPSLSGPDGTGMLPNPKVDTAAVIGDSIDHIVGAKKTTSGVYKVPKAKKKPVAAASAAFDDAVPF